MHCENSTCFAECSYCAGNNSVNNKRQFHVDAITEKYKDAISMIVHILFVVCHTTSISCLVVVQPNCLMI